MPFFNRCKHENPIDDCDLCAEARAEHDADFLDPIICSHCNRSFGDAAFERHRFNVMRRTGEPPKGRRVDLR